MGTEDIPPPPPGWFDDPDGRAGVKRYWDGSDWTDQYDYNDHSQNVPEQRQNIPDYPQGVPEVKKQFASLRTIAVLFRILGWLTLVLGSIGVIVSAAAAGSDGDAGGAGALVVLIGGGLGVAIYTLMFFAFSAFIYLMISVEETNRRTAAAVEGLLAQRR